jgi:hypothetical protein
MVGIYLAYFAGGTAEMAGAGDPWESFMELRTVL